MKFLGTFCAMLAAFVAGGAVGTSVLWSLLLLGCSGALCILAMYEDQPTISIRIGARTVQNEDFIFANSALAQAALEAANKAWINSQKYEYYPQPPPDGRVRGLYLKDDESNFVDVDDPRATHWAAISDDSSYMVPNFKPHEWFAIV